MRKVEFNQGSEEWLAWRKKLLTATDAAQILGVSPYSTAYKCWQRKLGLIPEQASTPAMQRGVRDEPIARQMFIKQTGINMTPCCVESDLHNFIGSSLDGISDCGKYILEIKSQKFVNQVPEFHYSQIQHQLLSTDFTAKVCYYVSMWEGEIQIQEVSIDTFWHENYLPKATEFWKKVIFHEQPELTTKDYKDMNATPIWESYATEYRRVAQQIKQLEELKESYRKELITLCEDNSCMGAGIKVLKKLVKGRVDYESIPEISHIDLERYRKQPSTSWTILLDGK